MASTEKNPSLATKSDSICRMRKQKAIFLAIQITRNVASFCPNAVRQSVFCTLFYSQFQGLGVFYRILTTLLMKVQCNRWGRTGVIGAGEWLTSCDLGGTLGGFQG